jgi:hypothetical protein
MALGVYYLYAVIGNAVGTHDFLRYVTHPKAAEWLARCSEGLTSLK